MANNTQNQDRELIVHSFNRNVIIDNYQSDADTNNYVNYGIGNAYPNFLLSIYENGSTHKGIVNSKATYVMGGGLALNGEEKPITTNINQSEPIGDFLRKVILDYAIFNYFCVEVIFNKLREPIQYKWVPAQTIRTNKKRSKFWYRPGEKWGGKMTVFEPFVPGVRPPTSATRLFFFDGYFPTVNAVYPAVEYSGAIKSIVVENEIKDFNLNNITNHFSVSTLITFFMGSNLPKETKEAVVSNLKNRYSGARGGKLIVDFQQSNGQPADVKNIDPNSWDAAYTVIAKDSKDDIFIGHQVTSPMLMGVKTEGQLGGATELETAYEIFKTTYVLGKRAEIEAGLNRMFAGNARFAKGVHFIDKKLFTSTLPEATREKVLTVDELRAVEGLPALPNGEGARLLTDSAPNTFNINAPAPDPVPAKPTRKGWIKKGLTDEDFDRVADVGESKDLYEVVSRGGPIRSKMSAQLAELEFDRKDDIAKHIVDENTKSTTIQAMQKELAAKGLEVTATELREVLESIAKSGVANIDVSPKGEITITPDKTTDEPRGEVFTMYEYNLRPGVDGPDIIPGSRGFCRKLVANNRYYSRADIQTMSGIFGYDVFQHAGGYWHNPETNTTEEHCRHRFEAVRLRRKKTT